jgi:nucleotide-binding universal stress UspA family protein
MKTKPSKTNSLSVLCGTDFTTNSAHAADAACALAKLLHAPLDLVHVSGIPAHPPLERELAAEAARLRKQGAEVHASVMAGIPDEELVRRAVPKSCRMVVVSSLGRRPRGRWLLGSVSERTAERASVPTLVVRNAMPFLEWARGDRPLKVFVAFNFTATAEAALRLVKTLLEMGPCDVVVGYVDFPPDERARLGGTGAVPLVGNLPEVQTILERDLKTRVTGLLGTDQFRIRVDANWGQPSAPLAAMATQLGADLVVVGSHQYHGFERFWHGSVSSGILRDAVMSVAVVPMPTTGPRAAAIAPPLRRVMVATDFSVLANRAIPHAYSLLRGGGGTLHLVHVAHPHEMPHGEFLQGPSNRSFKAAHAKHLRSCSNKLHLLIPSEAAAMGISTEIEVAEHENPATGICQAAERCAADAICCSTQGLSGLSKTLLGSVAQKIITHSTRPLLLVRPAPES